jgi:hypothetical protein
MTPEESGRLIRLIMRRARHADPRIARVLLQTEIQKALEGALSARDKEWRVWVERLEATDMVRRSHWSPPMLSREDYPPPDRSQHATFSASGPAVSGKPRDRTTL